MIEHNWSRFGLHLDCAWCRVTWPAERLATAPVCPGRPAYCDGRRNSSGGHLAISDSECQPRCMHCRRPMTSPNCLTGVDAPTELLPGTMAA